MLARLSASHLPGFSGRADTEPERAEPTAASKPDPHKSPVQGRLGWRAAADVGRRMGLDDLMEHDQIRGLPLVNPDYSEVQLHA